jgi:hypothetical protein
VNTVLGLLLGAAVGYWAVHTYLPQIRSWRDARRAARKAEHERIERRLRELFAAPATQPLDIVDGPGDRSDREIHGMTAPELAETNAKFEDLIGREWPNQT